MAAAADLDPVTGVDGLDGLALDVVPVAAALAWPLGAVEEPEPGLLGAVVPVLPGVVGVALVPGVSLLPATSVLTVVGGAGVLCLAGSPSSETLTNGDEEEEPLELAPPTETLTAGVPDPDPADTLIKEPCSSETPSGGVPLADAGAAPSNPLSAPTASVATPRQASGRLPAAL